MRTGPKMDLVIVQSRSKKIEMGQWGWSEDCGSNSLIAIGERQ